MARKPGFGASIASEVVDAFDSGETPELPSGDVLASRGKAISRLGADVLYEQFEWIDPALCRPSKQNARHYDDLTYSECADLIESIKSEGRQRMAAVVRRTDDPAVPYEIVAGSRRHFAISWLRANNYPEFRYLVDVQKLDDEAAFRLSDLENRAREDVSDLERARSYAMALKTHYKGDVTSMSERLGMARATVYRYLALADLDQDFIAAFGDSKAITVSHPRTIATLIKEGGEPAERVRVEASRVAEEQARLRREGQPLLAPAEVLSRFKEAAKPPRPQIVENTSYTLCAADGSQILTYTRASKKRGMTVTLPVKLSAKRKEVEDAFAILIDEIFENS
ncbi:ParB/RepB/Spo0J family partition protein [Novosphingobium sp. PhB57]|jgi:ParB family chromosome partitioning protein|uniref:ParB/RepB/Spo0J family partition protein n=1 Tax=Novosphingobium sp. PhB57 TaxID=2485107 RepID=UPI00104CE4BF|nr:ParB/RepB/Spo0J family partition protein [Novosphingobium sp. PhB57]